MLAPIALTGLTLAASDPATATRFYTAAFGLDSVDATPHGVTLRARLGSSAVLQLILQEGGETGLRQLRFAARDRSHLAELRTRMEAMGHATATISDDSIGSTDPDGTGVVIHVGEDPSRIPGAMSGDRPLYMSHVVVNSREPHRLAAFYQSALGLEVTDRYERDLLLFMRCDQPQHHCLGISPSLSDGLNHFAVDCGSVDVLMRAVSRMRVQGHEPIWGPGRHGPGGNIFCYFEGPDGVVPEFTCDVLQIENEDSHEAQVWSRTPENANVWLSGAPSPRALELMSGEPHRGSDAASTTE